MSLTKAQLLEKAKPRVEAVDVPGYGKIHLRSCPQVQQSRRDASYFHADGTVNLDQAANGALYAVIDQVCEGPPGHAPIFTDEDLESLAGLDASKLKPILDAVAIFNGAEAKNVSGGSND